MACRSERFHVAQHLHVAIAGLTCRAPQMDLPRPVTFHPPGLQLETIQPHRSNSLENSALWTSNVTEKVVDVLASHIYTDNQ